MSDGSLSQEEIDALLQGTGDVGLDFGGGSSGGGSSLDTSELGQILSGTVGSQGSNLSMLMGKTVTVSAPQMSSDNRDGFLTELDDEIVSVSMNMEEGVQGAHGYVLSPELAIAFAGNMMGQEQIDLNEAALSALQEALSNINGPVLTAMGDKTGSTLMAAPPEAVNGPKAGAKLPGGNFAVASYDVSIDGASAGTLYELFDESIVNSFSSAAAPAADPMAAMMGGGQPAMNMGGMDMGMQQPYNQNQMGGQQMMGQQQMGGYQMGGQQMMGQPQMGGMQMGMPMGGMMGQGPNVQNVQFPGLQQVPAMGEAGNISLLMDVYMEMTVELGRTKKLIKEILGMGEGTIIELDKLAGEPVDILVNHKLIAKGEVVVIDENFGVRVTEIVSPMERMSDLT